MFKFTPLLAALAFALATPLDAMAAPHDTGTLAPSEDAAAALERISEAGFHAPWELEYRHGLWVAEGTSAEGLRLDILVDPATGEVFAVDQHGNGAISAQRVEELVRAAGYSRIDDLELDDGFWELEAIDPWGREVELVVHPLTGAILNAPDPHGATPLTAAEIRAALAAAGYTRIHDLEYDSDGYWEADAVNRRGQKVELRVDPYTGAVLREELDD